MTHNKSARSTPKKSTIFITIYLAIGLGLAYVTYEVLMLFNGVAHNELFGWLAWSGVGIGSSTGLMGLLIIVFGADILWAIFLLLWLLKKKMHLDEPGNTLRLP